MFEAPFFFHRPMIQYIKDLEWTPSKAKSNSYHYITFSPYSPNAISGYASMMWNYACVMIISKKSEKSLQNLFREVDSRQEVGTLYPEANVTIIPSLQFRHYSDEKFKEFFDDVIKANCMVGTKTVYLDLRNSRISKTVLDACINGTSSDDCWKDYDLFVIVEV